MLKITSMLIDDESKNNELLSIYLKKYCPSIQIVSIATSVPDAIQKLNALKPKVTFLDIIMGDGTGFDVLDAITYSDYLIVFITAYQEYAISAFKFNAVDFILKPIDPKDLLVTFKRIEDCFKNNNFTTPSQIKSVKSSIGSKTTDYNFIAIPSTKKIDLVRIDDILYLESDGRYTTIHLVDKSTLFVSKNIVEYEKLLSTSYFFCIHKKYMINLKYIINISNSDGSNCELVGKLMLPVAKRRKEDLVSFLNIR